MGHVDVARRLLERGADISAQDEDGSTPLHCASRNGHLNVARMLVECGADISAQVNERTPLRRAPIMGYVDALLERGADMSTHGENGWTPLHYASRYGHVGVARMLMECGADVSAQAKDRWTPLHHASYCGLVDMTRMLVEHGANMSVETKGVWTPW